MKKSATEVMEEILFSAVIDSVVALKAASKGLPNNLLRDLNAIHGNITRADLPPELQAALTASVRSAFARLLREGFTVAPAADVRPPRPPRPQGERPQVPRGGRPGKPGGERRGPRPEGGRPPRRPRPR